MMESVGVIGNEASDADSIVSAIALASFYTLEFPMKKYLSFVQLPLDEITSRLDFAEICKIANYSELDLFSIFDDHSDFVNSWILVDHNFPSAKMQSLSVVEIIDHHEIEDPEFIRNVKFVQIEKVASCASLVARRILGSNFLFQMDPKILRMLQLTILLDTGNFRDTGKVTDTDRHVSSQLESHLTTRTYEQLVKAKWNPQFWLNAPTSQLLRYDIKEYYWDGQFRVGMTSVMRELDSMNCHEISEFAKSYDLFVLVGFHRSYKHLFVVSKNRNIWDRLVPFLVERFQLEPLKEHQHLVYKVGDSEFSRKIFIPFVRQVFSNNPISQ